MKYSIQIKYFSIKTVHSLQLISFLGHSYIHTKLLLTQTGQLQLKMVLSNLTHETLRDTLFGLSLGLVLVPSWSDLVKVVLTTSLLGNRPGTYPVGNSTAGCQKRHATCGPIAQIDQNEILFSLQCTVQPIKAVLWRRCFQWNLGVLKAD